MTNYDKRRLNKYYVFRRPLPIYPCATIKYKFYFKKTKHFICGNDDTKPDFHSFMEMFSSPRTIELNLGRTKV